MKTFKSFLKEYSGLLPPNVIQLVVDDNGKYRNHEGEICTERGEPTGETDGKEHVYKEIHKTMKTTVTIKNPIFGDWIVKPDLSETRLPKFSVFKKDREGGHIHIDDFDKHSEAKQEALLSSAEDPHVDHMIIHNQTGIPAGIFKGGKHIFNEEYLEEGKPKSINVNEVHTNKSLDRLLISLGWTALPRAGGHQKYFHPDHPEHLSVPVHSGDLNKMTTKQIIKKATGT